MDKLHSKTDQQTYLFGWKLTHRARELLQLSLSKFQSAMRVFDLQWRDSVQFSLSDFLLCFCIKLGSLFLRNGKKPYKNKHSY